MFYRKIEHFSFLRIEKSAFSRQMVGIFQFSQQLVPPFVG
ncbi:hypothetical protein BACPLE_00222 [Phocaeicola plebeius DSM 17135]|uniref:Uncharacterized protein n=1 Tax=Phocaeicola plebeius (strain DSM 17135 / JCM 12973 / CCUG 54634 / M2) TaxID=484018 RepID=B5CU32_PHOPM|nr:hypothetical protein BACPLE_00222 [Phocaeicola plebeius DSM 17135]